VLAGHAFAAGTLSISVGGVSTSFTRDASSRSTASRDAEAGEALFRAADAELYRAKARGRNRVSTASSSP
jgi:GGDEF domain-containing protein